METKDQASGELGEVSPCGEDLLPQEPQENPGGAASVLLQPGKADTGGVVDPSKIGVAFEALASGKSYRTSSGGGWKITLDVPESEREAMRDYEDFLGVNVQVGIIKLP